MSDSLLTDEWLRKLAHYNTLFVGFSGGLDSTVLLHSLARESALIGKLQAVHVHHGLSVNAGSWQSHCQQFCEALNVSLIVRQVNITHRANIEERARIARYQVFDSLLAANDCLLLAHHSDDQAETLLLQLLRGAGIDGLAAMADIKILTKGERVRPFLHYSRQRLEAYAAKHQLSWVDDESNRDITFSRNFLRQQIIPLLQEKWPKLSTNLARTAMHCQHAKTNLDVLAKMDCRELSNEPQDTLAIAPLHMLSYSRLANVLRCWLRSNNIRLPSDKILNQLAHEVVIARSDATPMVQWGGITVRRYQQRLYLLKNKAKPCLATIDWTAFPAPLPFALNGKDRQFLYATVVAQGLYVPVGRRVQIRFRQGGELFSWRGQTKQLKKLLQEWHIPPWQRDMIPLFYIDNELAAVIGFAISDQFFSSSVKEDVNYIYHVELKRELHADGASSG